MNYYHIFFMWFVRHLFQHQIHEQILRSSVSEIYGAGAADDIRILYGGSVKPGNIADLMAQVNIDGALVGGPSLEADSFASIIRYRTS